LARGARRRVLALSALVTAGRTGLRGRAAVPRLAVPAELLRLHAAPARRIRCRRPRPRSAERGERALTVDDPRARGVGCEPEVHRALNERPPHGASIRDLRGLFYLRGGGTCPGNH